MNREVSPFPMRSAKRQTRAPEPTTPKVLIVEDERVVATHIMRSLTDIGYHVVGIIDSAAEVSALVDRDRPDVALVDIRIRGEAEGIEIAKLLREAYDIPVIYLTAHSDEDTLRRAVRVGAYGYVIKPVTMTEVRSAIEVALYKHELDKQLAEREQWFKIALGAIADGVIACDTERRVTFINDVAKSLTGHQHVKDGTLVSEICGERWGLDARMQNAIATGRVVPFELVVDTRNGERVIDGSVAPIAHGGAMLGAVLIVRDITDRKQHEQQMAMIDRLSSLGTLVASVAHEINNPLAYTVGNVGLARSGLESLAKMVPEHASETDAVSSALREAETGAERVAQIVRDLRSFGRKEEQSVRTVDPVACVQWALKLTTNQVCQVARLDTDLREVPHVLANELKLAQVFVNLLTKAAQAIRGGREDNAIGVATGTESSGMVFVDITDTGPGIPVANLSKIFEPFFTTKPTGIGTGLGLSICRRIVNSYGGEVLVSTSEEGSRFRVLLPQGNPAMTREPPKQPVHTATPPRRVLVVDDEPLIRNMLARQLRTSCEVTIAAGADEALEIMDRQSFDLILCDLMMPDRSGMDFYADVKRRYPAMTDRIAFATGGACTPETMAFLQTFTGAVLDKPFTREQLLEFVGVAFGKP